MTKKYNGPRLVNPEDKPPKEKIPYKTIILTTVVSGTAGFILAKILDHVWENGKKVANPLWNRMNNPPGLPAGQGQQQLHSPYSYMAQNQGLPFVPAEAPERPVVDNDNPPKWAAKFIEKFDARLTAMEQRQGPRPVRDQDEDAA